MRKLKFIRLVPIILCLNHLYCVSLALRCQTSDIYLGGDASGPLGGFFWGVSHIGNWWLADEEACQVAGMIPPDLSVWTQRVARKIPVDVWAQMQPPEEIPSLVESGQEEEEASPKPALRGSLELLWPFFQTACLGRLVETFLRAVSGQGEPTVDVGMTIFQHAIFFAGAERNALAKTFKYFYLTGGQLRVARVQAQGGLAVAPDVLYLMLVSILSHIASHSLALFDLQDQWRLASTAFSDVSYLVGLGWTLVFGEGSWALGFRVTWMAFFIPHIVILTAVSICVIVCFLAVVLITFLMGFLMKFFSAPGPQVDEYNFPRAAFSSHPTIHADRDFFTTLLEVGYYYISAAGKVSYLRRGQALRVPSGTWLQRDRAVAITSQRTFARTRAEPGFAGTNIGQRAYATECTDIVEVTDPRRNLRGDALGRWLCAMDMARGVFDLLVGFIEWVPQVCSGRKRNQLPVPAYRNPRAATPGTLGASYQEDPEVLYHNFLHSITEADWPDVDHSGDYSPSGGSSDGSTYSSESPAEQTSANPWQPGPLTETPPRDDTMTALYQQTSSDSEETRTLARHPRTPEMPTKPHSPVAPPPSLVSVIRKRRPRPTPLGGFAECVVCLCAVRTVVLWPCGCLCICEGCREALACGGFRTCVCCGDPTVGFSRVFFA